MYLYHYFRPFEGYFPSHQADHDGPLGQIPQVESIHILVISSIDCPHDL